MIAVTVVHSFTSDDMRTTMFSQEKDAGPGAAASARETVSVP